MRSLYQYDCGGLLPIRAASGETSVRWSGKCSVRCTKNKSPPGNSQKSLSSHTPCFVGMTTIGWPHVFPSSEETNIILVMFGSAPGPLCWSPRFQQPANNTSRPSRRLRMSVGQVRYSAAGRKKIFCPHVFPPSVERSTHPEVFSSSGGQTGRTSVPLGKTAMPRPESQLTVR